MIKFLVVLLATVAVSVVNAQGSLRFTEVPKMVQCGPIGAIVKGLTSKDIDERPLWTGQDASEKSNYVLFVNNKTGSFTIVQFGSEIGCIVAIGNKAETLKMPADGKPL